MHTCSVSDRDYNRVIHKQTGRIILFSACDPQKLDLILAHTLIYALLPADPELHVDVIASRLSGHRRRSVHSSTGTAPGHKRLTATRMQNMK